MPVGAVTSISIRQVVAGSVMTPPVRLTTVDAAVAPLTLPPQLLARLGVAATASPGGNVSLKARLVRLLAELLVTRMASRELAPGATKAGVKLLVRVGCRVKA